MGKGQSVRETRERETGPGLVTTPAGLRPPFATEDARMSEVNEPVSKETYLRESRLFAGLSAADVKQIERLTTMTECRRGRVFFSPEDAAGTIYVLKRGRVRLYRQDDQGRALTVASLDAGAVFGESALLGQAHPGIYAEAIDDGLVCVIPTAEMKTLIKRFPQIGLNLIQFLGERLLRSQELSEEMAYWPVNRRLAHQLLLLNDRYGRPSLTGGTIISERFTQSDLADMIGSTRQTVSELMGAFADREILTIRRRRIIIRNEAALRALASG